MTLNGPILGWSISVSRKQMILKGLERGPAVCYMAGKAAS